jgi:hypothetical protein
MKEKSTGQNQADYTNLAAIIGKARRRKASPGIHSLSMAAHDADHWAASLVGENLCLENHAEYPKALFKNGEVEIIRHGKTHIDLKIPRDSISLGQNELMVALDPATIVRLNLNIRRGGGQ